MGEQRGYDVSVLLPLEWGGSLLRTRMRGWGSVARAGFSALCGAGAWEGVLVLARSAGA